MTWVVALSSCSFAAAVNDEEGDDPPPPPLFPVTPETSVSPERSRGAEEVFEVRVSYTISDGFFIDLDGPTSLKAGRVGWLEVDGRRVARIEIGQVSSFSAFIAVVPDPTLELPRGGSTVRLLLEPLPQPRVEIEKPTTVKEDRTEPEPEFEPLLGPYIVDAETRNLFHGRAGLRHFFLESSNDLEEAHRTVFHTAGSIERLGGTPWAFEWSLDTTYRDGASLEDQEHYREVYPEVRRFSLVRRYDDRSISRVGRFLPIELPSVGTLDGAQGELVLGSQWRVGGMLGLRPDRDDLAPSGDEPTLVSYTTYHWAGETGSSYSATGGVLLSLYEGNADRFAFLLDQQANLGRWTLFSTSEIDFDIGAAEHHGAVRFTRGDLSARYDLGATTLHGGLSRFGIPDTEAERDFLNVITTTESEFFADDQNRATIGATHRLSDNWTFEEEISFIDSEATDDQLLWLVGVSKRGLLSSGSILTARVYQLGGEDLDGYGGSITGFFPFADGRLALMPSISGRMTDFDDRDVNLEVGDIGLRLNWRFTEKCTLTSGVIFTDSDDINRVSVDVGVTVRW